MRISLLERLRALKLTPLEPFKAIYCICTMTTMHQKRFLTVRTIKHPQKLLSLDLECSRTIFFGPLVSPMVLGSYNPPICWDGIKSFVHVRVFQKMSSMYHVSDYYLWISCLGKIEKAVLTTKMSFFITENHFLTIVSF